MACIGGPCGARLWRADIGNHLDDKYLTCLIGNVSIFHHKLAKWCRLVNNLALR